jgi:hypothetical protein
MKKVFTFVVLVSTTSENSFRKRSEYLKCRRIANRNYIVTGTVNNQLISQEILKD